MFETNRNLGYTSREEFIRDAIRTQLRIAKDDYTYIEIQKTEYEKLQQAIKGLDTGFLSADDFINHQIRSLLEEHDAYLKDQQDAKR